MFPPTSLRGRQRAKSSSITPFPTQQLFVLALCRFCEPIAFMSIFPYIYYMILDFNITSDDRQIAMYAGMITSAFAFAEFSTGVIWGKLSDKIGRKPVLITGLAGTGFSMLLFGFAPSLPVALLGRALGGFLNGNMGVLQTTVAELVTVKEHQPRAYSIMPFVWCLGSVVGPAIGGALAQPCKSYPNLFPTGTIFDRFPFLLPNLVCAAIVAVGVLIGILFLEETHETQRHHRDRGIECGKRILQYFWKSPKPDLFTKAGDANFEESRSLIEDEQPPGYRTTEGSPRDPSSRAQSPDAVHSEFGLKERPDGKSRHTHAVFTKQVVLTIAAFGILAYHTISFEQLLPVFLSTPVSHEEPSLPFKFTGGFALSPKVIGFMLSIQGVYSMTAQLLLFPFAVRRFGVLKTYRFVAMSWPLLYFSIPYLVFLPQQFQIAGVWFCLFWRVTAQILAYPSNSILLRNYASSNLDLGVINGVAASTASLSRAFGPTVSGFIHSKGLSMGYTGLAWWAAGLVCLLGALECMWLEDVHEKVDELQTLQDEEDVTHEVFINPLVIKAAIVAAGGSSESSSEDLVAPSKTPSTVR